MNPAIIANTDPTDKI